MLPMFDVRHDLSLARAVARDFIRDHHTRRDALPLGQLAQQAFGCFHIVAALDPDVERSPIWPT